MDYLILSELERDASLSFVDIAKKLVQPLAQLRGVMTI